MPPDPNDRTKGITGGAAHDVKPRDAIVVPAGTPHWFRKINGHVTMLEIRIQSARSQKKAQ
jgi:mannose-6-phosphate isomerase-like protein (cupin superfamily)